MIDYISIEKLRYELHQQYVDSLGGALRILPTIKWWKEYGAFVATLPRQCGKTTFVAELVEEFLEVKFQKVMVLVPTKAMAEVIETQTPSAHSLVIETVENLSDVTRVISGREYKDFNLIIDEYTYLESEVLDALLDYYWKSVTMVGTLK